MDDNSVQRGADRGQERPSWWPRNPYPETIFPTPPERYAEIVPDPHTRTALSGMLGREFWEIASKSIYDAWKDNQENLVEQLAAAEKEIERLRGLLEQTIPALKESGKDISLVADVEKEQKRATMSEKEAADFEPVTPEKGLEFAASFNRILDLVVVGFATTNEEIAVKQVQVVIDWGRHAVELIKSQARELAAAKAEKAKQRCRNCTHYWMPANWPVKYSDPGRRLCMNKALIPIFPGLEFPWVCNPNFGCQWFEQKGDPDRIPDGLKGLPFTVKPIKT